MVWSNWRTALVLMTAWVGLAWSQAPTPSGSRTVTDRILTVHENGKGVRCRVLRHWRQPDGSKAYEMQTLDTGEILTIVEAGGPPTGTSTAAGRTRARIFRWGQGGLTPPPGCPVPPAEPTRVVQASGTSTPAPVVVQATGKEETIWWEEKKGQRVSPFIVTDGRNPFEQKEVVTLPAEAPVVSRPIPSGPVQVVSGPCPETAGCPKESIVELPTPGGSMATVGPRPRSIVGNLANLGQSMRDRLAGVRPETEIVRETKPQPWQTSPLLPPPVTAQRESKTEPKRTTAWELPERTPWKVDSPTVARNEAPRPGPVLKKAPADETIARKIWRFVNPAAPAVRRETDQAKTETLPTPAQFPVRNPTVAPIGIAQAPKEKIVPVEPAPLPFSTATLPPPPKTYAPPRPEPKDLGIGSSKKTETPQAKKDWRNTWGKEKEPQVKQPGQPIQQAGVKPGEDKGGVRTANGKGPEELKRTEQALLNPEKFDPDTLRPRGIDPKNAVGPVPTGIADTGTPTSIQRPETAQTQGTAEPTAPGSPLMRSPGGLPLGAQSVLAAKSGRPGQITYVPVPVATVPEPYRAPVPPAPKMPEAPKPNQFANAFTPSPMPGRPGPVQPVGYLPVPQGLNPQQVQAWQAQMQAIMQAQAMRNGQPPMMMVPAGMPQGYPQMGFQPVGGMQMPAQPGLNYPRTYQGPQAPNPTAYVNQPAVQTPVQQTGYGYPPAYPMPAAGNPAMDRTAQPGQAPASADVAQLVMVLRESPYPAQREWAAATLATFDWRVHPQVLPALIQAAKSDPAANVRAGGVFALGRTNAATEAVLGTLRSLEGDSDPRVREEVSRALVRLQGR